MKLKKIYSLNKYSVGIIFPSRYKILFYRILCRFACLFILFFSLKSYSQKTIISGLENIHISEGATMIAENSKDKVTVITASSIKIYPTQKNSDIVKKEAIDKRKLADDDTKKTDKNSYEKLIKKIKEAAQFIIIYDINSKSNAYFQTSNHILEQGTTAKNDYLNCFLYTKYNWTTYLKNYQSKDNVLYLFYHSKKVEDSLFARPPPRFC